MAEKQQSSFVSFLRSSEEELFHNFMSLVDRAQFTIDPNMAELWRCVIHEMLQAFVKWHDTHEDELVETADFLKSEYPRKLGIRIAEKGREAGEGFGAFFSLFKLVRQTFVAFFQDSIAGSKSKQQYLIIILAIFDAVEVTISSRWHQVDSAHIMKELRRSRYSLLHEKRRYFIVFQRMAEPAFVVDDKLRLLDVNQAFERFFGIKGRDMLNTGCCSLLGQDACKACALEQAYKNQSSFSNIEVDIPVKGENKTVLMNGTFLGDINQEFPGILVILKDITEKKAIERALLTSEEKYRSLVENVPDAVWRADQTGSLRFISPNITKICGYPPMDFMERGLTGSPFIHPSDAEIVLSKFKQFFLAAGEADGAAQDEADVKANSFDVRYRFLTPDNGWIWLHDRAGPPYIKDGVWCADGVVSDITALKKVEEELERHRSNLSELVDEKIAQLRTSNEKLMQEVAERKKAEKELTQLAGQLQRSNRELEQFAHVASHDLKEPLLIIVAFCERLMGRCYLDLDQKGRTYLDRIKKSAHKMQALIDDILELSRISQSKRAFEIIDLNSLLQELVEDFEEKMSKEHGDIRVSILHELEGDRVQVRQLFQNIISNALKFRKENRNPLIQIKSRLLDNGICEITVEDNGIGINEKNICRIFNPFVRLHSYNQYEGTGIGLATCSSIALRHGGEITARSTPGKGTVFVVRIPQCQQTNDR